MRWDKSCFIYDEHCIHFKPIQEWQRAETDDVSYMTNVTWEESGFILDQVQTDKALRQIMPNISQGSTGMGVHSFQIKFRDIAKIEVFQ